MPKTLKTNPSVWTNVFRAIVKQLETDADFARVVGKDKLRSWNGSTADKAPFVPSLGSPVVRLTPMPSNVGWYSEDSQSGTLRVKVELAIASLCIDDCLDLWDLIVWALRAGNKGFALALVALGGETGEIVFSDPAVDAQPDAQPEGMFYAVGSFDLRVIRFMDP